MRDPYRKKRRDLRRVARSAQRPSIFDLFDDYHPEYKKYDKSSDHWDWHFYWDTQREWICRMAGTHPGGGPIPASYRIVRNRKLRREQRQALHKAFIDDELENFVLPQGRRDIRWLYW